MRITGERLKEIEARANAATPGPWIPDNDCHGVHDPVVWAREKYKHFVCNVGADAGPEDPVRESVAFDMEIADMHFIAHARLDIPDLVTEVWALRELLDVQTRYIHAKERLYEHYSDHCRAVELSDCECEERAEHAEHYEKVLQEATEMLMRNIQRMEENR